MGDMLAALGNMNIVTDKLETGMKQLNANLEEANKLKVLEIVMSMDPAEDPEMRAEAVKELRRYFF